MHPAPPPEWRPLTIADLSFLLDLGPYSIKGRDKRGNFPDPTWTAAGGTRMWAWCVVEQWAEENEHPMRSQADLDAYISRRR